MVEHQPQDRRQFFLCLREAYVCILVYSDSPPALLAHRYDNGICILVMAHGINSRDGGQCQYCNIYTV